MARRRVLVDTSDYFALANVGDVNHGSVVALVTRLGAEHRRLFTTNFVVAETHALILRRLGRHLAAQALAGIDRSPSTVVVRVSARDERRAREIIATDSDKDFSLTDATSFAVMERLHIDHALTLDSHFAQFGFSIVGADRA